MSAPSIARVTTEPTPPASASFDAIGCRHQIAVTCADALPDAMATAEAYLAGLDRAASRFTPTSELSRLNARAADGDVTAVLSPQLCRALVAALRAARLTAGLVDPTVGSALVAAGYDRDLAAVRARASFSRGAPRPAPGWNRLLLDPRARLLTMPRSTVLDVGASAKAMAADHLVHLLAARLPGGFLVNLGGDIAVGGVLPRGGWRLAVCDENGAQLQVVVSHGQALTTSSTRARTWRTGSGRAHHIIDPRTGAVAEPVWAQVSCCAATALEANAASTAALVLGPQAPMWLHANGVPALLVPADGSAPQRVGGWPAPGAADVVPGEVPVRTQVSA